MSSRAVFLDRDGVINERSPGNGYITRWEELHLLPDVGESIAVLNRFGFRVIVITNQRCVAKGLVTSRILDSIHHKMCTSLAAAGGKIDAVYYCPHEEGSFCPCRKPAPGMLLSAARTYEIDLTASWMIGDSDIDIEAGRNAGCRTVRLIGSHPVAERNADLIAASLSEAVNKILVEEDLTLQEFEKDARADVPVRCSPISNCTRLSK
jgi:D-glycero-D-manno-heptose 1,7-bisphosphate phosphatase